MSRAPDAPVPCRKMTSDFSGIGNLSLDAQRALDVVMTERPRHRMAATCDDHVAVIGEYFRWKTLDAIAGPPFQDRDSAVVLPATRYEVICQPLPESEDAKATDASRRKSEASIG
ncbi:hypothetical protein GHK46_10110 [Sinorhizobium medicae]|nr:hypothetical protein [Sinorhizobium medicae]